MPIEQQISELLLLLRVDPKKHCSVRTVGRGCEPTSSILMPQILQPWSEMVHTRFIEHDTSNTHGANS
jgi:hypothetical protein